MTFEFRKVMSTHVFKAHGYVLHGNRAVKPTWTILRQPQVAKHKAPNSLHPQTVASRNETSVPRPADLINSDKPLRLPLSSSAKELDGIGVNVIYIPCRESDASRMKTLLESYRASINLIAVNDDVHTRAHAGRIYYLSPGKNMLSMARQLVRMISTVERVAVQSYEFPNSLGITHSIWLVNQTPNTAALLNETPKLSLPVDQTDPVFPKHDYELAAEVVDKLLSKDFGALRELIDACLKGRRVRSQDQSLVTSDPTTLREYARILKLKVNESPAGARILRRILEDIQIFEKRGVGFGTKRLKWKLLPRGEHPFQRIVQHFQGLSKHSTPVVFDVHRLHKAYSLNPDDVFVGIDEFEGYVVFYFAEAETAVLDCPVTGNAIYIFGENWKSLSHLTKSALLSTRKRDVVRIVHIGKWFSRLKSVIATRRLNAARQ